MSAMSLMFFIYLWLYFSDSYTLTIPDSAALGYGTKVQLRVALLERHSPRRAQA